MQSTPTPTPTSDNTVWAGFHLKNFLQETAAISLRLNNEANEEVINICHINNILKELEFLKKDLTIFKGAFQFTEEEFDVIEGLIEKTVPSLVKQAEKIVERFSSKSSPAVLDSLTFLGAANLLIDKSIVDTASYVFTFLNALDLLKCLRVNKFFQGVALDSIISGNSIPLNKEKTKYLKLENYKRFPLGDFLEARKAALRFSPFTFWKSINTKLHNVPEELRKRGLSKTT